MCVCVYSVYTYIYTHTHLFPPATQEPPIKVDELPGHYMLSLGCQTPWRYRTSKPDGPSYGIPMAGTFRDGILQRQCKALQGLKAAWVVVGYVWS